MFGQKTVLAITLVLTLCDRSSHAGDDRWFFTPREVASAYKYQRQFGARLHNPLKPEDCTFGHKEFVASQRGRQFAVPCRFIAETIRQLRDLLESGAANYLFPLDVGHADFAVPLDIWDSKYKNLSAGEMLPALLREPSLMAIYYPAGHLAPASTGKDSEPTSWDRSRTVVGYYNGRRNEVLAPRSDGEGNYEPQGLVRLEGFNLMEHFLGEMLFVAVDTVVMFDLSFDDYRSVPALASDFHMTARSQ